MGQRKAGPYFYPCGDDSCGDGRLGRPSEGEAERPTRNASPVNILLILQPLHIVLQVGLVGVGRSRQRKLHFLHRILKVSLSAVDAGQRHVRSPVIRKLLSGRTKDCQRLVLLLLTLQLPPVEIKLQSARLVQSLGAEHLQHPVCAPSPPEFSTCSAGCHSVLRPGSTGLHPSALRRD